MRGGKQHGAKGSEGVPLLGDLFHCDGIYAVMAVVAVIAMVAVPFPVPVRQSLGVLWNLETVHHICYITLRTRIDFQTQFVGVCERVRIEIHANESSFQQLLGGQSLAGFALETAGNELVELRREFGSRSRRGVVADGLDHRPITSRPAADLHLLVRLVIFEQAASAWFPRHQRKLSFGYSQ